MRPSDQIRNHIIEYHVKPAQNKRAKELTLRAGDIHNELGYSDRMPAVCSVLGSNRLEREAGIRRLRREGPHNGANVYFVYSLE